MPPSPERGDPASIRFAMSAFGERDKVQETTIPSKQSTTGESQHLYPSMERIGDVRDHSMPGASVEVLPTRFAGPPL